MTGLHLSSSLTAAGDEVPGAAAAAGVSDVWLAYSATGSGWTGRPVAFPAVISTERLSLEPAPVEFIEALERSDRAEAQRLMNLIITGDWFEGRQGWMALRIRQLKEAPALDRWLLHAMVLAKEDAGEGPRTMVGHCGYHGAPDQTGMVEIGYRVAPPFQRRGYAIEAVRGLIANAFAQPEVTRVRASIRPDNEPSLSLTAKLGFVQVGEQLDEVDGLEYVFDLERPV